MTVMLDPRDRPQDPDTLLEQFLDYATARGLELYPAQEEAILEFHFVLVFSDDPFALELSQ